MSSFKIAVFVSGNGSGALTTTTFSTPVLGNRFQNNTFTRSNLFSILTYLQSKSSNIYFSIQNKILKVFQL